jgi:flagellar hook-length control protein FliK
MHLQPPVNTLPGTGQPMPVMQAQQFAADMNGWIIKNMQVIRTEGVHEAVFKLFPEQLGQVDVSVKFQNGQIVAQFMTDTVQGKEMLENQLGQLRHSLQQQGINVDRLEVSQHSQQGFDKDHQQRHSQGQHQQQNKSGKADGRLEMDGIDGPLMLDRGTNDDQIQQQRLQWMRRMPFGAAVNFQA